MSNNNPPRHGSLQFYPRVRAAKYLPRVNWKHINKEGTGLSGFIGYKVGMKSAYVKDNTPHSMTKGQRIVIPVTILECPNVKILSVRFYKQGALKTEIINDNLDKELKRKIKLPKAADTKKKLEEMEKSRDFDDIKLVIYSQVKKTSVKKSPDITEVALKGNIDEKINFVKNNIGKEISIKSAFIDHIVDIRGVTIGKGFQGIVKRYGAHLKAHKSEKGLRSLGSGGPWHPSRVTFRELRAGQMGFFSRVAYNIKVVNVGNINEKDINPGEGFKHYGKINTDYVLLFGSVPGPRKRQLLITSTLRENKKHSKKNYEFIEIR
ncbi:MAG: 50S ribosomal protein L3 [Candidatus Nanoarchaeia archaeon]